MSPRSNLRFFGSTATFSLDWPARREGRFLLSLYQYIVDANHRRTFRSQTSYGKFLQVFDNVREKVKDSKASVVILDFTAVPAIDAARQQRAELHGFSQKMGWSMKAFIYTLFTKYQTFANGRCRKDPLVEPWFQCKER